MTVLITISMVTLAIAILVALYAFCAINSNKIWFTGSLLIIFFTVLLVIDLYYAFFYDSTDQTILAVLVLFSSLLLLSFVLIFIQLVKFVRSKSQLQEEIEIREMYLNLPIGYQSLAEDGTIIDVNPAWSEVLGYSREEVVGCDFADFLAEKYKIIFFANFNNFKKKGYIRSVIYEMVKKNGMKVKVEFDGNVMYDQAGGFVKTHCIFKDVTERQQNQQARENLTLSLENKNKQMQDLMSFVSHDLKTPIVNIKGFLEEIEKNIIETKNLVSELDIPQPQKEKISKPLINDIRDCLNFIRAGAGKVEKMTDGLSYLSRIGKLEFDSVEINMNELIRHVLDGMQYQIKTSSAVVEIKQVPPCLADADALSRVFSNLISNAVKYRQKSRECVIKFYALQDQDYIVYIVEDNGIGIDSEKYEEIFQPFIRLGEIEAEGDGLGLNIAREIIKKCNGSITVESEKDTGTKFMVYLPKTTC